MPLQTQMLPCKSSSDVVIVLYVTCTLRKEKKQGHIFLCPGNASSKAKA